MAGRGYCTSSVHHSQIGRVVFLALKTTGDVSHGVFRKRVAPVKEALTATPRPHKLSVDIIQ